MKRFLRLVGWTTLALAVAGTACGYLVLGPRVRVIASPDGHSLVRIDPAIQHPVEKKAPCTATVFQFDQPTKTYRQVATFSLRNPSAPDKVLIANNGEYIVTFDDWDPDIGRGPNVLVVYRGTGEFMKAWTLEEMLTPEELAALEPKTSVLGPWPRRWRSDEPQMLHSKRGPYVNIPWRPDSKIQVSRQVELPTLTLVTNHVRPAPPAK